MTEQDKQDYSNLQEMFRSKGWKIFTEDLESQLDSAQKNAAMGCPTNDSWQLKRGEIFKIQQILGYENMVEAVVEQAEEEAMDA